MSDRVKFVPSETAWTKELSEKGYFHEGDKNGRARCYMGKMKQSALREHHIRRFTSVLSARWRRTIGTAHSPFPAPNVPAPYLPALIFLSLLTMVIHLAPLHALEIDESERSRWGVVPLPVVAYSPDTGGMFGGAAMIFYGDDVGRPREEKRGVPNNIAAVNAIVTTKESYIFAASTTNYLDGGRFRLDTAAATISQPQYYYGRGGDADGDVGYRETALNGKLQFALQIAEATYAGPLYHWEWAEIAPLEGEPELQAGVVAGTEKPVVLSGPGVAVIRDTTGGAFWPTSGTVTAGEVTLFHPNLGSTHSFGRYNVRHARYRSVWADHIVAVQGRFSGAWGAVPPQRLPGIGGDGVMRGLLEGRYRDTLAAVIQGEYRVPLGQSVAVVGFGSLGNVGRNIAELASGEVKGAAGLGFRIALNKEERVNLRIDIAYAPGGIAPYVNMGEAF